MQKEKVNKIVMLNSFQHLHRLFPTRGFTLIELLVVVLIIGILAAVALPQYQKAVEKSRLTEGIINTRAIVNAHQIYHLSTGEYAGAADIDILDVNIPGEVILTGSWKGRIRTKHFVYSPMGTGSSQRLAIAHRITDEEEPQGLFSIYISPDNPAKIQCVKYNATAPISSIQQKLCNELNEKGIL